MNPHWLMSQVNKVLEAYAQRIAELEARIKALEDRRGPGRPKNDSA